MFGERLKEERKRLGLTQPELAAISDSAKRTVVDWEKEKSSPNAKQLTSMSESGVDVSYLITGIRTQPVELPSDEALLLDSYRALSSAEKKLSLKLLLGGLVGLQNNSANRDINSDNRDIISGNRDAISGTTGDVNIDNTTDKSADNSNGQGVFNSPNSPISNSFNTQNGFTELPFIWACAFCGAMAWLLGALASWKLASNMTISMSFGTLALFLWVVTMVMAIFGYHAGKAKHNEVQAKNAT